MNFKICLFACLIVGWSFFASAVEPGPATRPAPLAEQEAPVPVPPPESQNVRDPTEAQGGLRQAIESMQGQGAGKTRAATLPILVRRGIVMISGKPPEALVEVTGGGMYYIHEGSIIGGGSGNGSMLMKIGRITADDIEVELVSLKKKVIIH